VSLKHILLTHVRKFGCKHLVLSEDMVRVWLWQHNVCNPCYLEGGEWEYRGLRPALAKKLAKAHLDQHVVACAYNPS
jgi:hypothetical protein